MLGSKLSKPTIAIAAANALLLGLTASNAYALNVGGVTISAGAGPVIEVGDLYENVVTKVGDTLSGYGEITKINGLTASDPGGFLPGGGELTFTFGGFTVLNFNTPADTAQFTGGWINFYLDTFPGGTVNFTGTGTSAANLAAASDSTSGMPWLTLMGHTDTVEVPVTSGNFVSAVVFGNATSLGTGADAGTGTGLFDVDPTGAAFSNPAGMPGLTNANWDTNTVPDNIGGFADFLLTSSFSNTGLSPALAAECVVTGPGTGFLDLTKTCLTGASSLAGNVIAIPEPGSLAVMGLGLLGLGALRRRKAVA